MELLYQVRLLTSCYLFSNNLMYFFFWLHCFFFAVRGLSLVVATGEQPYLISSFKVAACALALGSHSRQ